MPSSVNGSTGGGASAPAGTGVVTATGGAFVDPVASASTTRATLGLGGAAVLAVGTTAGTVAAGDDSRITGAIAASTLTTRGDIITRGASAPQRLALGTNGYVLASNGTDAVWATPGAGSWLELYDASALYVGGEAPSGYLLTDYVTAGAASAAPAFGPGQSIVACLYPGATPTGLEIVASHGNGGTRGWTLEFGRDSGSRARASLYLYGLTGAGSGGSIQLTGSEWSSGTPYVIAVAFQSDKSVRFSVNGGSVVTISAATGTYVPPTGADTLSLGAPRMHSPTFYPLASATIGEVRWYSTVISDADLVSACAGRTTGTIPTVASGTVIARFLPSDFAGGVRVKARDGTTWILKGGASVRPA